jgi:hypothetical protein
MCVSVSWPILFFWANFHNLVTKKGWQIQQRDFLDLKKKIAISWGKKT